MTLRVEKWGEFKIGGLTRLQRAFRRKEKVTIRVKWRGGIWRDFQIQQEFPSDVPPVTWMELVKMRMSQISSHPFILTDAAGNPCALVSKKHMKNFKKRWAKKL